MRRTFGAIRRGQLKEIVPKKYTREMKGEGQ